MRVLLKVSIPVETGNEMIKDGSLVGHIESIMTELKPEAAYFTAMETGERGCYIVVDLPDASKIPWVAEPFFLAFNASVEACPVMVAEDLMKAMPDMEKAIKKYGH